MTTFDDREKGFEKKFAYDQELQFKAMVKRDKLLGLWAAEKMGLSGAAAEDYAKTVIKANLEEPGDDDLFRKLRGDFDAKGLTISDQELQQALLDMMDKAIAQIEADRNK